MKRIACVCLVALAACGSRGESSAVPVPDSHVGSHINILDGGAADTSAFGYVITMAEEDNPNGLECDAIVVAPNLLMTARHCVANVDEQNIVQCGDSGLEAAAPSLKGDFDPPSFGFYADGPTLHPFGVHATSIIDDGRADLCDGADIAFVVLDGNLDGVPVATLAPESAAAQVGDTLTVVGWGSTSTTREIDSDVLLERDGISVMNVGPAMVQGPTKQDALFAREFAASIGFCNGDSGGPAIDAKGRVVGIVSRAVHSCDTGPDIYTSPQAHFDLAAQAFAAAGATFDPNGASSSDDAGTSPTSDAPSSSSSSSGCNANGSRKQDGSWLALIGAAAIVIASRRRRNRS